MAVLGGVFGFGLYVLSSEICLIFYVWGVKFESLRGLPHRVIWLMNKSVYIVMFLWAYI